MQILGKDGIGKALRIFLIILSVALIPTIIYLPFLLNHSNSIYYSMIIIYPNGLLLLGIVYEFMKLFKSLEDSNPFNYNNVKTLKKAGNISMTISILWLLDLIMMITLIQNTYINYIIVLIFLFALFLGVAIALYILSELFKSATKYKEENELTI